MKPRLSLLAAVAIISASALAYEVLLMRLFSIIQWHHFAYMMISLALLGYGISGVFLALNRDRLVQLFPAAIMANMLLFSLFAPGCFLLAQQIPFNPGRNAMDVRAAAVFVQYLPDVGVAFLFCGQCRRFISLPL